MDGITEGKRSIKQSVVGADKVPHVIHGGGGESPVGPSGGGPGGCPVTTLGHLDGVLYFLDAGGQKRELTARQLGSRHDLLLLFCGDDAWLREHHPKRVNVNARKKNAEPVWETVDYDIVDASAALQKRCAAAGLFGEHVVLRQAGTWRGPDGNPVVHCGDKVLIGDAWHAAGIRTGVQIWAAAAATRRPDMPCPAAIGRELQDGLKELWRWGAPGGPVAIMGLLANAYYGAVPQWRPAGFVTGETGGGKSALLRVMRAALPLHHYDNDTTKAGIEQAVSGRAMAIIIDEAADRANRTATRDLVDLVLSAAGDEGTKGSRGTVDGRGRRIDVVGLIIMFSINTPELEPQHLGRFAVIDLRAPEDGADHAVAHAQFAAFAAKHSRELWGRALAGWDRYVAALERFRAGLRAAGCAPREMDQVGALLAGWWVLVHEGLPDARGVREGIGAIEGYVRRAVDVEADSRPRRMLQHLLSSMVSLHRSTDREPIGKLLEIALGRNSGTLRTVDSVAEVLGDYGIRIVRQCLSHPPPESFVPECRCENCRDSQGRPVPRKSNAAGAWFANQNPELRKVFEKTPFEGERWSSEAKRLPGAESSDGSMRIGSASTRAVWLSCSTVWPETAPRPNL